MTPPQRHDHTIAVSPSELRELFNGLEIARKGREQILTRKIDWVGKQRPKHLPVGSRSKVWHYLIPNSNRIVAVAHVYLDRRRNVIGEPDPKMLHIDELIMRPQS